jgi:hypothetical protein
MERPTKASSSLEVVVQRDGRPGLAPLGKNSMMNVNSFEPFVSKIRSCCSRENAFIILNIRLHLVVY